MASPAHVEPDLDFIAQVNSGLNLKKCYQCAACSVACTLSQDDRPFPGKEMIHAAWGLKDRLIANPDIRLCCNCGDCSALCPRDARPGDVLNTLRKMSIKEYSKPAAMHRLLNDSQKRPLLFIIPALILIFMGLVTGLMDLSPGGEHIVFALYLLNSHGPYDQINPVKILANVSGIALIAGSLIMIQKRRTDARRTNGYFDWYLLGLALFLGITGMLTQMLRPADISRAAYSMYFIHLIFAFNLVAFLPYTKLAHLVYRTVDIGFNHYAKKELNK
jgi:hypothetical protein